MKADIEEKIYIEIPKKYQKLRGAVVFSNNVIYTFLQAGSCRIGEVLDSMAIPFDQSKEDSCVSRKIVDAKTEIMVIIHAGDILAHSEYHVGLDVFATELQDKSIFKDVGDAGHYTELHITRSRKAHE